MNSPTLTRYNAALSNFPTPGGGGAHAHELKVSNLGIMAGLSPETIFQDIRRAVPRGKRNVSDREIQDAINKALQDHNGGTFTPKARPAPVVNDGKAALQKIIDQAKITTEVDLWEASPIRLWEAP